MADRVNNDFSDWDTVSTSSCASSSTSNLSARPKGLTSQEAIGKLEKDLWLMLRDTPKLSYKSIVIKALDPKNETSLFPGTLMAVGLLQASYLFVLFILGTIRDSNSEGHIATVNSTETLVDLRENPVFYLLQSVLVFLLVMANLGLTIFEQYNSDREMRRRIKFIAKQLEKVKPEAGTWIPANYPHLHTPLSSSVVLQWTLRNGSLVNLPWSLLVEGDVILIKPGQVSPGRCHSLEEPYIYLDSGQVLHMRSEDIGFELDPKPRFRRPLSPQMFVLDETPYLKIVRMSLDRHKLKRPASVLWKYYNLFFVRILCHWLCPLLFFVSVVWTLACYMKGWLNPLSIGLETVILSHSICITLPLVSLVLPPCWVIANHLALAKLLCVFGSLRHVKITDDPFDDTVGNPEVDEPAKTVSCQKLQNLLFSILMGTGEFLSRSENMVHTLGSITALCCTDKKGILSWPNTSAEKIFLLKKKEEEDANWNSDKSSSNENTSTDKPDVVPKTSEVVAEILSITHDHTSPFNVEFDDPNWKQHIGHLKPLGLSILLNTCNIRTEEKYTNFFNHLTCESMKVGEQVSERRRHHEKSEMLDTSQQEAEELASCVDVLPIVTRGCLCQLSKKIGLSAETNSSRFKLTNQIQTFRHVQTDLNDKFAKHLSLANLKFPFPHMVSVMVEEGRTHAGHLISQGTADIILDACADLWTGNDLEQLSDDVRKKILDFYHRSCLSAYCTAFAYRPLTFTLPNDHFLKEYLQLPTHNLKFYSQHSSEDPNVMDADILVGGDVSQWKMKHREKVQSATACMELECNQTFLGMVQLEYQARVDMVQLIDFLEKACIRFVHFSKENELRSRVFSEKMGLESGWNCHISLRNNTEKHGNRPSVTSVKRSKRRRRVFSKGFAKAKLGASIPADLERQKNIFDYVKWHEIQRKESIAVIKSRLNSDKVQIAAMPSFPEEDGYHLGSISSRPNSAMSDSDPFEYDMSNRAKLPEGIDNIRPHLEMMDNVPLLVSLFTDCTPDTTTEMVVIMQEYGEVVCVMGSSAQFLNVSVFLQADASLAIEPLYPQLCQSIPVFAPPTPLHNGRSDLTSVSLSPQWPAPVAVSQLLNSLASSLSFRVEDEISLFHLIQESRHWSRSLLNAIQFWTCSSIAVSVLNLVSVLITLPLFLTSGQALWLTLVFLPIISMSIMGNKVDPEIMNLSTGKNIFSDITSKEVVCHTLWCYGMRFLPTVAFLSISNLLTYFYSSCASLEIHNSTIACENLNSEPIKWSVNSHLNLVWTEIYITIVGLSFLLRGQQLWQRNLFKHNIWFFLAVALLFFLQSIYSCVTFIVEYNSFKIPQLYAWLVWTVGVPVVLFVNELVKRQEIKVEVRYQKRQRLEFQTKLGINSPF